jgi:hypothetical protein
MNGKRSNLFEHVRARPDTHVVTYSGLAAELPLLNLAAMEHKLLFPPQLRTGVPIFLRPGMWRPHIDLALELKGQGRDWAHLSEIGLRLGLPGELFAGKAHIEEPTTSAEWQAMRARVSMDCVLTAMVALVFWRANGRIQLDQVAMLHHIASWCQRVEMARNGQAMALSKVRQKMFEQMSMHLDDAAKYPECGRQIEPRENVADEKTWLGQMT